MTVVFKIGGSLLELPQLAKRISTILSQRPDATPLLIVGGGKAADLVRHWDDIHDLGDERAHWLAVRAMDFNAAMLASLLPRTELVESRDAAASVASESRIPVLSPFGFLRSEERRTPRIPLPHCWDVTSDSIAAWVTLAWPAAELVLIKSRAAPERGQDDNAVDPYFPQLAPALPRIGWVNLRDERPVIAPFKPSRGSCSIPPGAF